MTNTFEIKIARQYDIQILADTIITAVEGGIGYWSQVDGYKWSDGPENTVVDVIVLEELRDDDMELVYHVDCETIRKGMERILQNAGLPGVPCSVNDTILGYIHASLDDNSAGMIDATTADCILQAGIFNSIIFG